MQLVWADRLPVSNPFNFLGSRTDNSKAIGGSCVSDLFAERQRANAMAIYSLGPLLAPSLGPAGK